jgi:hypothetical protein
LRRPCLEEKKKKKSYKKRAGGVAQVLEYLPSKPESLNSHTGKKKKKETTGMFLRAHL